MFVYPAREGVALPDAYVKHAIVPSDPSDDGARADRGQP